MARGTVARRFVPSAVPTIVNDEFLGWLQREFSAVALGNETLWDMPISAAPPIHLREGMLRYADGVAWNPGAGKGVYIYNGTAWAKL